MTIPKPTYPLRGSQLQVQLDLMLERIEQTGPDNQDEVFKTVIDATRFKIDNHLRGSEKIKLVDAVEQMYDKLSTTTESTFTMSAYSNFLVVCPQDQSVAIHAATVLESLAEAFETFRDKSHIDAIKDVHDALLNWEELTFGYDPAEGTDFSATITTEQTQWYIDFANPQWVLDLRQSIFHGRFIFEAAVESNEEA